MGIITISREFGSGGEAIARLVSEKTGFLLVNKDSLARGLADHGIELPAADFDQLDLNDDQDRTVHQYIEVMHEYIYDLAIRNDLVILGRGGSILFKDYPPALHVRIIAQFTRRVQRVMKAYNLNSGTAVKLVKEKDRNMTKYYRQVFDVNWNNLRLYNLVLNTELIELEDATDIVVGAYRIHAEPREVKDGPPKSEIEDSIFSSPSETEAEQFMHSSEEEFAHMLDFYRIQWEYEPNTFLLEWDSEGNVVEAFSPDFYLPDQDLYIELTTQKPRQVWKKNRKIRRMNELYPHINIRLIDKKGFESLLKKHSIDQEDNQEKGEDN